ncbi:hypothetical protein L7F22_008745 [Adiantum nelumboides]|nr:hypothetical protein [Adiantum nelumboides]
MYINAQELGTTIPLVNDQAFDKSIKRAVFVYIIFVKDSLNGVNETQVNESGMHEDLGLSNFLNQFRDVFIDDIPRELPPKQGDDDHVIKLLPVSSPPNKPPYRVSQAQQEEITRQVNELVEKGMANRTRNAIQTNCSTQVEQLHCRLSQERCTARDNDSFKSEGNHKEAEDYVLIEDNLYRRGKDDQLRMCATEEEYVLILQQAHSGQAGGHFSAEKMAKSISYAGIWWPTLFMDAEEFVKRCNDCQRTKTPRGRDDMPLRPMMGARPFAKWGIDFVGPCPPAYKSHVQYIIVAMDYLTKWVEAKTTTKNDAKTTAQFLYENIFTRYGLPIEIVSDRGTHFINEMIEQLLDEFMVIHQKSSPYHPQANGQAESTNKILVTILTKIVSESRADWDQKLHSALWAYRVAYKTSIGMTPFNMVYGIQAILPLEFLIPTLRVAKKLEWTGHELSEQIDVLEKLDETRLRAVASIYAQKRNMKSFFDQHVINKEFAIGDYILVYTLKQHSRKMQKRGNGPYVIQDILLSGAIKLETLKGEEMPNWISGCRLKKYHLPLTIDMLAKIHGAKERKNKLKEIKVEAQEEARIRILKRNRSFNSKGNL